MTGRNQIESAIRRSRMMTRKLGRDQSDMLRSLKEHHGWYRGCGWLWSTVSRTERILDSLVKRDLVTVTEETFSNPHMPPHTAKVYNVKE